jgi:hypothetical protein
VSPTDQTRAREGSTESPWSPSQRAAIWAEADWILADPSFKKSRRCVILFRRLVEHALEGGDEGGIKERTLGIEVFGREADYDTNTDPIVRMTANEIRKRLAQYYQSSPRHHEVNISLVPGSYLPRFSFGLRVISPEAVPEATGEADLLQEAATELPVASVAELPIQPAEPRPHQPGRWMLAAVIAVLLLAGVVSAALKWTNVFRSNQYLLWAPLLKSPDVVTICVADATPSRMRDENWASYLAAIIAGRVTPGPTTDPAEMPFTPYVDAEVSARLGGWLKSNGEAFRMTRNSSLTLDDFRHSPVVLIGAFDNSWNLVLLSKLRYHVQVDPVTKDEWIEDSQNLQQRDWKGSGKLLYSDSSTDYALITRYFDRDTGNWILAAGGLGMHGTEAAGDLLSDPELSRSLPEAVRSGNRNFQIVLRSTVIAGHAGAPQILAVHTW